MDPRISRIELVPGSHDRLGRGVISHEWWKVQKAFDIYSLAGCRRADFTRAIRAHENHCRSHPKDRLAADRLLALRAQQNDQDEKYDRASKRMAEVIDRYKKKMLVVAGIPPGHRPTAQTDLLYGNGAVRILFDRAFRDDHWFWRGWWVLHPNGKVDRMRTPPGTPW